MQNCSQDNSQGRTEDAQGGRKEDDAGDNPQVVGYGGQGRDKKTLVRLDDTGQKTGNGKEYLSHKHDPQKLNHDTNLGNGEAGSNQPREGVCKYKDDGREKGKNKNNQIHGGGGHSPGFFFVLGQILVKGGNKGGREGTDD